MRRINDIKKININNDTVRDTYVINVYILEPI